MVVQGNISGIVHISDLGKSIRFGEYRTFTDVEIRKSDDLKKAIDKGWLKIIKGILPVFPIKSMSRKDKRAIPEKEAHEMLDQKEIMRIAKQMAKAMASEMTKDMMKDNKVIKEIAKEMATEMVTQIQSQTPTKEVVHIHEHGESVPSKTEEKFVLEETKPDDVFVDIGDTNMKANMNQPGKVREEKSDLSGSLSKMKTFIRRKKPDGQ